MREEELELFLDLLAPDESVVWRWDPKHVLHFPLLRKEPQVPQTINFVAYIVELSLKDICKLLVIGDYGVED